jgi:hypothetical protein
MGRRPESITFSEREIDDTLQVQVGATSRGPIWQTWRWSNVSSVAQKSCPLLACADDCRRQTHASLSTELSVDGRIGHVCAQNSSRAH